MFSLSIHALAVLGINGIFVGSYPFQAVGLCYLEVPYAVGVSILIWYSLFKPPLGITTGFYDSLLLGPFCMVFLN